MKKDVINKSRSLIDRIKRGDERAFQTLFENHQRLVMHIVCRMISNVTEREDMCQEIFIKVYQNLDCFRYESKLSTWIAKIAYNTCINQIQKKKILLYDDHSPEDMSLENISGEQLLPDTFTEEKDMVVHLQREIDKLDVRYRTILTLYHLIGMNYSEIGLIMELPDGTVKSHLFRARKILKKQLLSLYRKEELWHTNT